MLKSSENVSKADLHVYSKYSNRPRQWFLRRIGAPESFMEPTDIYSLSKKVGMNYVTITDHNTIQGSLDIAHLPDTFISSILTTYFPEDGCKIYCIVLGISASQFEDMQHLRENIYDLQKYMVTNQIVHSIAHPLYQINNRLSVHHFEKLILLFKSFQAINGIRDQRACKISTTILENITPALIEELSNRHNIKPVSDEPWKKCFIGGSNDIGGLFIGNAYTTTPHTDSVEEYLGYLQNGFYKAAGEDGTSIRFASSMYRVLYQFYRKNFLPPGKEDRTLIGNFLKRFAEVNDQKTKRSFPSKIKKEFHKKIQQAYIKTRMTDVEQMIITEASKILDENEHLESNSEDYFKIVSRLSQELSFFFLNQAIQRVREGKLISSIQAVSSMGPMVLAITPYLTAFTSQHKDESLLKEVCEIFPIAKPLQKRSLRKAWVTDTFDDVNGVTKTIKTLAEMAKKSDVSITIITSIENKPIVDFPLKNFKPVGSFALPEYESITVSFPPFMEILSYFEEEEFDEVIISTPGPLGLCSLGIAKILGMSMTAIYHTDFPRFLSDLSDDEKIGDMTWRFMKWFYEKANRVLVPTYQYKELLAEGGINKEIIEIMPRGINHQKFNTSYRVENYWNKFNVENRFTFIYVGRISMEKNIDHLLKSFTQFNKKKIKANLVLVGDGPLRERLQKIYTSPNILFTGYLYEEELTTAYASADCFVFPSMTDTFGNVVLEAHACGLPAIVSNEGGPQEIVDSHKSGIIVNMRLSGALENALREIMENDSLFKELQKNAISKAKSSRWEYALEKL